MGDLGKKLGSRGHQELGTTAAGAWLPGGVGLQSFRYTAVHKQWPPGTAVHKQWPPGAIHGLLLFYYSSLPPPSDPNTHAHIQSLCKNKDFLLLQSLGGTGARYILVD